FLGEVLIGPSVLFECAILALAVGDAFRRISPIAPMCSELTSGLADALDSLVGHESESVDRTSAKYSEPRVPSLDFPSEGVASSSLLVPAVSELPTRGVGVREVDPCA